MLKKSRADNKVQIQTREGPRNMKDGLIIKKILNGHINPSGN